MKKLKLQVNIQNLINPLTILTIAVILRLIPHMPNIAPIAAMALFGGVYLNKRYALLVPLIAMLLSDMVLGFSLVTPFVYGSFLLTGVIGLWLRSHKNVSTIAFASIVSSTLFFLITNLGVWLVGGMYSHTLQGLENCYILALPFFRNTLIGDLLYTGVLFGSFEIAKRIMNHGVRVMVAKNNHA